MDELVWERSPVPNLRCFVVREARAGLEDLQLTKPEDVAKVLCAFYHNADREIVTVLLLDRKHHAMGINTVSVGTIDAAPMHPREVFRPAMIAPCATIVVGHNHLSGDPSPSVEDKALTKRMVEVGALVGIPVLDHLIVACRTESWCSLRNLHPELFANS